ncbi:hypothetical protein SK128_028304 [Halocaridina rubra]|uniref:CCHC-type domain-containing protein n=1 Tax=Halocaridina rubra TaxID=373956 RepID=A0AAN8XDV9_HALRR
MSPCYLLTHRLKFSTLETSMYTTNRSEQCRFFKWADEVENNFGGGASGSAFEGSGPSRSYNRRGGISGRQDDGSKQETSDKGGKKRRCGLCGEEGHDRRNCSYK